VLKDRFLPLMENGYHDCWVRGGVSAGHVCRYTLWGRSLPLPNRAMEGKSEASPWPLRLALVSLAFAEMGM
jgi:hypothetical protein